MWRIFVPLNYLRIKHPDKYVFDLVLPLFFCALMTLPLFSETFRAGALGQFDIIGKTGGFLGLLAGFFIAALAAVATFGGKEMDAPMPGSTPVTLQHAKAGQSYSEDMSRRRFLSYLFGYLAFLSLFTYFLGYSFVVFHAFFLIPTYLDYAEISFIIFWVFYSLALGNLLSNTLLGLYYLTDRIHRPNGTLIWNSKEGDKDTDPAKTHLEPAE